MNMLKSHFSVKFTEAGIDEAGRGCLAGPVFAAAVILPKDFRHPLINDSKKLTAPTRNILRNVIEEHALAFGIASASPEEIDEMNILNATCLAMHRAIALLKVTPGLLLVDGNRFNPYPGIHHRCIVRGDATYLSIAAASILAKTCRDEYMENLHQQHPQYGWDRNKGYPTPEHKRCIAGHGLTEHHRRSFRCAEQLRLFG
jgi:ribonuclease HII